MGRPDLLLQFPEEMEIEGDLGAPRGQGAEKGRQGRPLVVGGATAPPVVSGPETRGPEDTTAFELIGLERVGVGYLATYAPPGRKGSLPNHLGAWVRARSPPSRP